MNVKRRPRALAALVMLAAMGSGTAEALAGELADANEHYEEGLSHIHEHSATSDGVSHVLVVDQGSDEQHVKGFDHCAHTHGSSARAAGLPEPRVSIIPVPALDDILASPPDAPTTGLYHPPKA